MWIKIDFCCWWIEPIVIFDPFDFYFQSLNFKSSSASKKRRERENKIGHQMWAKLFNKILSARESKKSDNHDDDDGSEKKQLQNSCFASSILKQFSILSMANCLLPSLSMLKKRFFSLFINSNHQRSTVVSRNSSKFN